jgi:hypothetical protein
MAFGFEFKFESVSNDFGRFDYLSIYYYQDGI